MASVHLGIEMMLLLRFCMNAWLVQNSKRLVKFKENTIYILCILAYQVLLGWLHKLLSIILTLRQNYMVYSAQSKKFQKMIFVSTQSFFKWWSQTYPAIKTFGSALPHSQHYNQTTKTCHQWDQTLQWSQLIWLNFSTTTQDGKMLT